MDRSLRPYSPLASLRCLQVSHAAQGDLGAGHGAHGNGRGARRRRERPPRVRDRHRPGRLLWLGRQAAGPAGQLWAATWTGCLNSKSFLEAGKHLPATAPQSPGSTSCFAHLLATGCLQAAAPRNAPPRPQWTPPPGPLTTWRQAPLLHTVRWGGDVWGGICRHAEMQSRQRRTDRAEQAERSRQKAEQTESDRAAEGHSPLPAERSSSIRRMLPQRPPAGTLAAQGRTGCQCPCRHTLPCTRAIHSCAYLGAAEAPPGLPGRRRRRPCLAPPSPPAPVCLCACTPPRRPADCGINERHHSAGSRQ